MKPITLPLALVASFILVHGAFAADYEGADAILKQIAAKRVAEPAKAAATDDTPAKLTADLEAFRKTAPMLAPDEAASGWLDLADRFSKIPPQSFDAAYQEGMRRPLSFDQVVAALPPPAAWPALAKAVDARPDGTGVDAFHAVILRLVAHRLIHDKAALSKDIDAMKTLLAKIKSESGDFVDSMTDELKSALLEDSDNGDEILKQLDALIAKPAQESRYNVQAQEITVPDLVTLVGRDRATDFLKRALASSSVISSVSGEETTRLARKLALEMIADLKQPQWALTQSLDSTALFEAMEKRFPVISEGDPGQQYTSARTYYLLGLIAAHRTKDAISFAATLGDATADSLPQDGINALERAGLTTELADFFYDLLSKNPDLPFWSDYVDLAVRAGQQKKMVALAETSAARTGLDETRRRRIQGYLGHAYLATDRVDEGIAILRQQIADAKKQPNSNISVTLYRHRNHYEEENVNAELLGIEFARLGTLLERKDLVEEGIQTARDALKTNQTATGQYNPNRGVNSLAILLIELDRGPEAEAVLKDALLAVPEKNPDISDSQELLMLLMEVYHRANRPADVLALLDRAPFWGAKDLSDIFTRGVTIDRNIDYAGYFAADALAAQGSKPQATAILDALLDSASDYDPAYKLLLKLEPADQVLAKLDALYARDKYESRPMIWKAQALLDAGKLEEAETAARLAVTIDPSDGEHGPGRRMQVYTVLANIREARGDKKEAEFFRGVVTSIRHSEDADRFYEAGLISRAIKMYEESLTHFADAYCIQSRLALRMAEMGDMAGAEEHYKRAYELMPDSFGRVESHCFGCEGAFQGYYAQNIAEKVFTDLVKKRPDKPQVHYLLGYLRDEQDRYADALPEFREAVKLDPEYLNAWKKIAEISGQVRLPAAERDSIELHLIQLDPLGHHSSFDANKVIDLAAAWNALEAAEKLRPVKPATLYPLPASAELLARQEKENAADHNRAMRQTYYDSEEYNEQQRDPGNILARNGFLMTVSQMYGYGRAFIAGDAY